MTHRKSKSTPEKYGVVEKKRMARGRLGRKAKKVASMAYQVNRALGVPKAKAKARANKAGRKVVAKATGGRKYKNKGYQKRRRY